jgi:hypothetical protein
MVNPTTLTGLSSPAAVTSGNFDDDLLPDLAVANNDGGTLSVFQNQTSFLEGVVWLDLNNDGQVDFDEKGITGVKINLTGVDSTGSPVSKSLFTDKDGAYVFDVAAGTYGIEEIQPAGYLDGKESLGTGGGSIVENDRFCDIQIGNRQDFFNYNFGERPLAGSGVQQGQSASIGFWQNKNGQSLIKSFNGNVISTLLGNWLAATLPGLFGVNAGASDLTGKTNAQVAAMFQQRFLVKGVKVDAQVMATALAVYATTESLGGAQAAAYGFSVSAYGLSNSVFNVGSNGAAFGVANGTTMSVLDLLQAADALAVDGVLYGGNTALRKMANDVFSAINEAGGR